MNLKIILLVIIIGIFVFLGILVTGIWFFREYIAAGVMKLSMGNVSQEELYPKATKMPSSVPEKGEELLKKLELVLQEKAPEVLNNLNPGISTEKISELEKKYTVTLPDELKALYRWRNGCKDEMQNFIPGHTFEVLEKALENRKILKKQLAESSGAQKMMTDLIMFFSSWIAIFPDPAGDGYFYDPERSFSEGAVFFCFRETGEYQYYPSVNNLLQQIIDCYESGIYNTGNVLQNQAVDYKKEAEITEKYAECIQ